MLGDSKHAWLMLLAVVAGCGGSCGNCTGFREQPQGTYTGPKQDSAASVRVSQRGFSYINSDAGIGTVLSQFAPGGALRIPLPCSVQTATLFGIPALQLVIGDEGGLFCTSESCGQMDGRCSTSGPTEDIGRDIVVNINALTFAPKAPDIVEAQVNATIQTGVIHMSSVVRNACLFSGPIKCSLDFDTSRAPPSETQLGINIKLGIDTKWDKLLTLEVASVDGTAACGGANQPPNCIDGNDFILGRPPGTNCGLCTVTNIGAIKSLLIGIVAGEIQKNINKALADANCATCPTGTCPMSTQPGVMARCEPKDGGPGKCVDTSTSKCVPGLLGLEGRANLSAILPGGLIPADVQLEVAAGAGGSVNSSSAGTTVGMRAGAREVTPARCVAPKNRPPPIVLPLPDFEGEAPDGGYDVALSLSSQMLNEALYGMHQSGTFCVELGTESVSLLESALVATALPSLALFTPGKNSPVRAILRPVNPPTVTFGEGTVDAAGKPKEPLMLLDWQRLEVDLYALVEDRMVRLFTVQFNLKLPMGLSLRGCAHLRPVIGELKPAIENVRVINSELLIEETSALEGLIPVVLSQLEPQLMGAFPEIELPDIQGLAFKIQLLRARGVGRVNGTTTYHHLGVYARLYPRNEACPAP